VALCGAESLAVMNLLMHVENPSPQIIAAVDAAAAWFEKTKIMGIRIEDRPQEGTPKGFERHVVKDPEAGPLWARFYETGTNKPIFVGRDGVVKYDLMEIDTERRTGYRWYGAWAKTRLEREYPAWRARVTGATTQPVP
jgi:PelA/Pel-15E family pectate lyase